MVFWSVTCRSRVAGRCSPSTEAIKSASTSIFGLRRCQTTCKAREEREFGEAVDVVAPDQLDVDPEVWTHTHAKLIRAAARDPAVIRILVNPAIKKALCREAGADRAWLFKVRPWYGHAEHFHVQIACPAGSAECKPAAPPRPSDGCGHELDFWFKESTLHPPPSKPKPALTLAGLPPACKQIVKAP